MDHCGVTSVHRRQLGQVRGSWQGAELSMSGGKDQVAVDLDRKLKREKFELLGDRLRRGGRCWVCL